MNMVYTAAVRLGSKRLGVPSPRLQVLVAIFPSSCSFSFRHRRLGIRSSSFTSRLEVLSGKQSSQVSLYVDTLLEWNQFMNLTAVTERSSVMERHIADSLSLLPVLEDTYMKCNAVDAIDNVKVVDVGSGAGLPGIVLAIARPSWKLTLMESLQKRCNFLEHVTQVLGLTNIEVIRARAEDAGQEDNLRETFDVAVSRAVAELRVLVELCLPLIRVGGLMVAAKGANPEEEVKVAERAVGLLGATMLPPQKENNVASHQQPTEANASTPWCTVGIPLCMLGALGWTRHKWQGVPSICHGVLHIIGNDISHEQTWILGTWKVDVCFRPTEFQRPICDLIWHEDFSLVNFVGD